MRRLLFTICFLVCATLGFAQPFDFELSSEAAILINADTGNVLFGKNKDKILYPASITKVATALYIVNRHGSRLEDKVIARREALASITPQAKKQSNYRCPAYWLDTDGTHIGIKAGEEFVLKTLLTALLVSSANDAANVMAEHLEGTVPNFVEKMHHFLKEIGCKNTSFHNPHGLHHPQHKTTAEDMALIAKEAMRYPIIRQIVAMTHFTCPRTNLSEERYLTQTNHLLRHGPHYYKKAIGMKTGSTSQAGKTLIAAASDSDRSLIAIVFGCPSSADRYNDVVKMFDKVFNEKKMHYTLLTSGLQKVQVKVPCGKSFLRIFIKDPLYYDFFPSEKAEVITKIVWSLPKLPIQKGQCVGEAQAHSIDNNVVARTSVYAFETVEPTFTYQIKQLFIDHQKILIKLGVIIGILLLGALFWIGQKRTGKRRKTNIF